MLTWTIIILITRNQILYIYGKCWRNSNALYDDIWHESWLIYAKNPSSIYNKWYIINSIFYISKTFLFIITIIILLFLHQVETPIHCIEEYKGQRKHHSGIFVNDINIFNGGNGRFDRSGMFLQRRDDLLSWSRSCPVDARSSGEAVVAVDSEWRWEFDILKWPFSWEEFWIMSLSRNQRMN